MQAIRITRANLHKILNESPIDRRDLEAMIEEYDTESGAASLFFVPQHDMAHSLTRDSWMTIPWRLLNEKYNFDKSKISTQFVEITQK